MKNWKLDIRFSSALSQRGPLSLDKVEKKGERDDASSWNDDLYTRPVYIGNPCAIKTSLILLPIGNCDICVQRKKKKGTRAASILSNIPGDERLISLHVLKLSIVETICRKYHGLLAVCVCVCVFLCIWLVLCLACGHASDSPVSALSDKTSALLQKGLSITQCQLPKPSWLILQTLDNIRLKSTSLLLTQRKQAFGCKATPDLLYYGCPEVPSVAGLGAVENPLFCALN